MTTTARRLIALPLATALALALSLGIYASQAWAAQGVLIASGSPSGSQLQAQSSKVCPSKKAAKKAVIAKVKAKWKKTKQKIKVENAATTKNMTSEQRKAYKKFRKSAGKNAKKYKFYFVTIKNPRFTVKAKYKDSDGTVKTYSFTAYGNGWITRANYFPEQPRGFFPDAKPGASDPETGIYCTVYAARKGKDAKLTVWTDEYHTDVTGKRVKNGDFGYRTESLGCAKTKVKLKG